jgi:hypothetical protein
MNVVVRPHASTDLEGVARLRPLLFDRPEESDAHWQSSIWDWLERHPLANNMHRWVLDAGGEVVGHLAALPQFYRIGGQRVIAHTPADYGVLPQYGFHALSLMRKFFRTCENCVACDTAPAVIGIETRLGAAEVGKLQFAAKVWDISGVPHLPVAIPMPVQQALSWGLRTVDVALNSSRLDDNFEMGLRAEVLEGFDESFDELFESVAAVVPCVPEKDAAFLRWRYGANSPQASPTILGVRNEERLLGYAVLWVTVGGDDGHLLDLTTLPGRHDVARSLLRESTRRLRRIGVRSIRYRFVESSTSPLTKNAWRIGYVLSKKRRFTLLAKFTDPSLHQAALDLSNWSYSFGDGEPSFWVR